MPDLVPHRFRLLARSVGLAITTVTRGDEKKKILVYSSRWSALSKAAVHILPASVSLFLLTMNFQGRFIGRELQGIRDNDDIKLSLLQVAAKLQELLVVASLASIMLHIIRTKLLFRSGVPLGLLGAHKAFTDLR
ncbi:hypothetical protein G7054_g98 [Neopestalotiopsis clavispora]|nr:hypothetical protein G7054_g98 [Neopestalotiopsis clavispora]